MSERVSEEWREEEREGGREGGREGKKESRWCYTKKIHFQIPEPDVAIHSLNIDPDGAYLAAVNSKVRE